MAIKKKYEDSITVGSFAEDNLSKAMKCLNAAGFKKVRQESPLLRVKGNWKPIFGTLFGDITLNFQDEGRNTRVSITIVAAVDNAYALASSPGERLKAKFLDEFTKITTAPNTNKSDGRPNAT